MDNKKEFMVEAKGVFLMDMIAKPARTVLDGISLTLKEGELVSLMGPSGAGKTSFLHVLGGMEKPEKGEVFVAGMNPYTLTEKARAKFRREQIGFVFQGFNLIPELSAAENVALPLWLRGGRWGRMGGRTERKRVSDRVSSLMEGLGLTGLQGHGPEQISGGEQQRLALARALAVSPKIVLGDEPTGNLDWRSGQEVINLLIQLCKEEGKTALLVTHDVRVAALSDRVLLMREGKFIEELTVSGILGERGKAERDWLVKKLNYWEM